MRELLFAVFWICGIIIGVFTNQRIREYKNYANPECYLCLCVFLYICCSWGMIWLSVINGDFELPLWLYHDCNQHEKITFEDTDYDKDGNIMTEYDTNKFGHRETYRVYTCQYCGRVRKERLQ